MNTQSSNKSVSVPNQPSTSVPVAGRAVASAADQTVQAMVQAPVALPENPRLAQPVTVVIDRSKAGGSGEGPENSQPDEQDYLPAAVAPVSLDEAISMSLSEPQRQAIQLLTSGKSLIDAATAAGVNRTTLYRWLKGDPAFVAAYNAWQKDVRDTARGRILALSELAITTIAKAMIRGDAKAAITILKATGALTHQDPGSTDPNEIQRLQKLERTKAQTALKRAEGQAELDAMMPM